MREKREIIQKKKKYLDDENVENNEEENDSSSEEKVAEDPFSIPSNFDNGESFQGITTPSSTGGKRKAAERRKNDLGLDDDEIEDMMNEADKDGDGQISFPGWYRYFKHFACTIFD